MVMLSDGTKWRDVEKAEEEQWRWEEGGDEGKFEESEGIGLIRKREVKCDEGEEEKYQKREWTEKLMRGKIRVGSKF